MATHLSLPKNGGVPTAEAARERPTPSKRMTADSWARAQKWPLLCTTALVILLYAPNFAKLWSDWKTDENYSHGILVPFVFLWILWERRKELGNAEVLSQPWALVIVVLALLQLAAGTWGAENFVAESSLLLLLGGITLYLFGNNVLRLVAFPIAWLTTVMVCLRGSEASFRRRVR